MNFSCVTGRPIHPTKINKIDLYIALNKQNEFLGYFLSKTECHLPHSLFVSQPKRQIKKLAFQVDFTSYNIT